MVIARVVHIDRSVERYSKTCSENMRKKLNNVRANNRVTKVVVVQASAYIFAFVITNLFPFFNFVTDEPPLVTQALTLVFLPLQGFFNLLIFMGHKVYNYRRVSPGVSRCEALRTFFFSANVEEPMYISQLSRVEKRESNNDDGQDDEEDYESYQDDGPPTSPKSMHRDASEGDAVFFDENESKSSMSWMAKDEDGLFSYGPSSVGRSSGMSETSRSKSTRGENDQSNSGSTKDKQSSSKSYLSYSIE
jgi:hypothetical protein